jgi:hypothetical protein
VSTTSEDKIREVVRELPDAVKRNLDQHAGCVAGAALVSDVGEMLLATGFHEISVTVKEEAQSESLNGGRGSRTK